MGLKRGTAELPEYVVSDTDRHDNVRYYFRRRPAPKVRLEGIPGSEAFMNKYYDCLDGKIPERKSRSVPAAPGSFAALRLAYLGSPEFKSLDVSTRAWQRRALDEISEAHGTKRVAMMQARHVRTLRNGKRETPAAANTMLKALKALFKWANENGRASSDPTRNVDFLKYAKKGFHPWSPSEVEAYEAAHLVGTTARLALELLLYTAGRREDVVRFGPHNLAAGRFRFVQGKNEDRAPVLIDIPVHPDLAEAIAAAQPSGAIFILTHYGRPFTPNGFGNRFKKWCIQAGLPHCSAHGCRKAAAARLATRGATAHQIMSVTGHQSLAEVERYTRSALRAQMADTAMALLPDRRSAGSTIPANRPSDSSA
ncbi:integrase [Methylobacterium sp. Leaf90]|nr:integrase [Methylobacterium sp. Leaf90]